MHGARFVGRALVCALALVCLCPQLAAAGVKSDEAAVLQQDQRWLEALMKGDRATIDSILAPNYKHVTSDGKVLNRDQELAAANVPAPPMKWTLLKVDIAGDTAVVHGLNTMTDNGKTIRELFTDVFVKNHGAWLALAAQETLVPSPTGTR